MGKFLQEFTQRINQCLVDKNCQKPIEFSGGQCCPPFEKLEPELKLFWKFHAGNIWSLCRWFCNFAVFVSTWLSCWFLERQPVPIDDFERHVSRMHMDGDHGFSEEYSVRSGGQHAQTTGAKKRSFVVLADVFWCHLAATFISKSVNSEALISSLEAERYHYEDMNVDVFVNIVLQVLCWVTNSVFFPWQLVQPDEEFSFQQFLNPANKYKNRYANIVACK